MRFLKGIFSRWVIISLLIIIQILLFCYMFFIASTNYAYIAIGCDIVSILVLLYLISSDENPNHRIPWIVVLLIIPPIGLLIYLIFGKRYISKKHSRLYQSVNDKQKEFLIQDNNVLNEIKDIKYINQSNYINKVSNNPIYSNTNVSYFSEGKDYFNSLFNDLKQAKKYIFLEYFIISEGKLLNELLEILYQKVEEGLDIRVIYDDVGSIKTLPYNFDKLLIKKGIKCVKFNKYAPIVSVVYNNRDHRKIAVIDGEIAYTGGVNIADEYVNYIEKYGYWKDNGIRLIGDAVTSFTLMFLKTYDIYSNSKTNYKDFINNKKTIKDKEFVQPFGDGPAPIYDNYVSENVYLNIINQANKYIYITTPYLIVDHNLMNALENASKRGVDARIITPGIPDKKLIFYVTRSSYNSLIKAGVKIYEYQKGFIHAKTIIADDEVGVVGTINFDYRSLVHHFECGCLIIKNECLNDIKNDIINTLNDCKTPDKKLYKSKSFIKKIFINILKFFAPLM